VFLCVGRLVLWQEVVLYPAIEPVMLFRAEPDDTGIRPLIDAPLCCLDHDLMQKSLGMANRGPPPPVV
jgi:hypothetical protein